MEFNIYSFAFTLFVSININLYILFRIEEPVEGILRNGSSIDKFLHSRNPRRWIVGVSSSMGMVWYIFSPWFFPSLYTPEWAGITKGFIATVIGAVMTVVHFYLARAALASFYLSLKAHNKVKEKLIRRKEKKKKIKPSKGAP